jgi:hypothetical protein
VRHRLSFDLLAEQGARCREGWRSLFGGFTLEAASSVVGRGGDEFAVFDLLSQLVAHSRNGGG